MIALVLTVPESESELAADTLWALGVLAVEERAEPGTDRGMIELWTSLGDDADAVTRAAEGFPARWRWRLVDVDDTVAQNWRAHVVPSWITPDLVIVPAWLPAEAVTSTSSTTGTGGAATVVRIEPGATFGLGDHPTTVLTLRAMRGALWPGATVLDVGCGSGVVGVTAALSGASYVAALDVADAAVAATHDNAARNGVAGRVTAATTPLAEVEGPFDVVCANILAPVLVDLADDLRRVTAPAGVLIVSGVLADAHAHVVEALAPMQVVDRFVRDGWAAVVLRH